MNKKSKISKVIYFFIIFAGIIVVILSLLDLTGIYSVREAVQKNTAVNKPDKIIIDEWKSEPFGDLNAVAKIESYNNNMVYINLEKNDGTKLSEPSFMPIKGPDFSLEEFNTPNNDSYFYYCGLTQDAYDSKGKKYYCANFVPMDCEEVKIGTLDYKAEIIKGKIKTENGPVEFKILMAAYDYGKSNSSPDICYIDKDGKEHRPQN